jgi:glyoxylase-like metal-dependent hydrolase (beta-lactamase superfamily II)
MATVDVLAHGYARRPHVASTVGLVRDGDAVIVTDPGMVAARGLILEPLAALGVRPEAVTHVFISHHHPDHTVNIALFPEAEVVDFWASYRGDLWTGHAGDTFVLSPRATLWRTPGHTEEDASLIVEAEDGVYAFTHLWWREDRTPEVDPLAWSQAELVRHRERVLAAADVVVPGHGRPFRTR